MLLGFNPRAALSRDATNNFRSPSRTDPVSIRAPRSRATRLILYRMVSLVWFQSARRALARRACSRRSTLPVSIRKEKGFNPRAALSRDATAPRRNSSQRHKFQSARRALARRDTPMMSRCRSVFQSARRALARRDLPGGQESSGFNPRAALSRDATTKNGHHWGRSRTTFQSARRALARRDCGLALRLPRKTL